MNILSNSIQLKIKSKTKFPVYFFTQIISKHVLLYYFYIYVQNEIGLVHMNLPLQDSPLIYNKLALYNLHLYDQYLPITMIVNSEFIYATTNKCTIPILNIVHFDQIPSYKKTIYILILELIAHNKKYLPSLHSKINFP